MWTEIFYQYGPSHPVSWFYSKISLWRTTAPLNLAVKKGLFWADWAHDRMTTWPLPNFLSNFFETKFALELSINVMKHTLHKWGGYISSIHNVIGKKTVKVRTIPKQGGEGWDFPTFFQRLSLRSSAFKNGILLWGLKDKKHYNVRKRPLEKNED